MRMISMALWGRSGKQHVTMMSPGAVITWAAKKCVLCSIAVRDTRLAY
jgi:hypothetical protein